MNIAIVIGISQYDQLENLPACKFDAENMANLLKATDKYEEVELIVNNTTSTEVKNSLRKFFKKNQDNNNQIEEAFVYFSGHGFYHQDDSMFCCTDFNRKQCSVTSISNREIDDLLRSVSPKVAVKIIDACESGAPYIKGVNEDIHKMFVSDKK